MDVHGRTERHDHFVCRIDADAGIREGEPVELYVDMQRAHFFAPGEAGRNLSAATTAS